MDDHCPDVPGPVVPPAADHPFHLNLDQQRKRARDLLRACLKGDAAAEHHLRHHHPRAGQPPTLTDAQHAIARELGLASWPRLKAHILAIDRARAAIRHGDPAPDADRDTLHIRCGSDIRDGLRQAGFAGDFLEVSDPLCHGPVPADGDLIAIRAAFIVAQYGAVLPLDVDGVTDRLTAAERALRAAAGQDRRLVLWMEHDAYDQLILARCLAVFAEHGAPASLELIQRDRFPGRARFIGLGQLDPEALRMLWTERVPLDARHLALGHRVWAALRDPSPEPLARLARDGTVPLPVMAPALRRHLAELPGVEDGLSLTERLTLDLVAEAGDTPLTIGRLFGRMMRERDPLPALGDVMYLAIIADLARAAQPTITLAPATDPFTAAVTLTDAGRAVLDQGLDAVALAPPVRWVGGCRIDPAAPHWRWDRQADRPVLHPAIL